MLLEPEDQEECGGQAYEHAKGIGNACNTLVWNLDEITSRRISTWW